MGVCSLVPVKCVSRQPSGTSSLTALVPGVGWCGESLHSVPLFCTMWEVPIMVGNSGSYPGVGLWGSVMRIAAFHTSLSLTSSHASRDLLECSGRRARTRENSVARFSYCLDAIVNGRFCVVGV